jgi:archaellum biogenesis protein FlaJ (TadC family)
MSEENREDFSKYEDEIIILLNKLSSTINAFNTLSRDQAEKAILETNSKLANCKEILEKMEQYTENIENEEEFNKAELNKKIINYKTEYHEMLNKFNEIQDNYITKKTENALLEKENDNNLVDEDDDNKDKKNKNKKVQKYIIDGEIIDDNKKNKTDIENKKVEENGKNNKNDVTLISVSNNKNILQHNNSQVLHYSLNPNANFENDEAFNQINKNYESKKRKTVLICVAICIFIFLIVLLSATLSRR